MQNIIEYILFRLFSLLVRLFCWKRLSSIGKYFGRIIFYLFASRRKTAISNLRFAFPQKSDSEIYKLAKKSFESLFISFLEILWFSGLKQSDYEKVIEIENPKEFERIINLKSGAILLSSHFGNWELLAMMLKKILKRDILIVVQKQRNNLIDEFVNNNRKKFGATITYLDSAPRDVLNSLQNNNFVAMIADQSARKEEIQVPLFGRTAPTHRGPAIFSLRVDVPLIFLLLKRIENGKYILKTEEVSRENLIGTNDEKIFELTLRHVQMLEKYIIETPDQWLWGHKRWKHSQNN
ncbi:MAG: hypothetical protein AAB255_04615 [Bacteroidota bacterium]